MLLASLEILLNLLGRALEEAANFIRLVSILEGVSLLRGRKTPGWLDRTNSCTACGLWEAE